MRCQVLHEYAMAVARLIVAQHLFLMCFSKRLWGDLARCMNDTSEKLMPGFSRDEEGIATSSWGKQNVPELNICFMTFQQDLLPVPSEELITPIHAMLSVCYSMPTSL
jgi:hypothetical protein